MLPLHLEFKIEKILILSSNSDSNGLAMRLKDAIKKNKGFAYVIQGLEVQSSLGKDVLLHTSWMTSSTQITEIYQHLQELDQALNPLSRPQLFEKIRIKLSQLKDIRPTVSLMGKVNFEDLQFFEIKYFCLLSNEIASYTSKLQSSLPALPDLTDLIGILDPAGEKVPTFYVYPQYHPLLAELRQQIKLHPEDVSYFNKAEEVEQEVRTALSSQIAPYKAVLEQAISALAYWDIAIAKVIQSQAWKFVCPQVSSSMSSLHYQGLFHPQLLFHLRLQHKKYQAVAIDLYNQPALLTGSNMSGKTVLLKTLATAQYMCQFGFFVPAVSAQIPLFDEVFLLMEDGQSELKGLSAFASEIMQLQDVFTKIKQGKTIFLLVDELARTTNPTEGSALIDGFLQELCKYNTFSVISTHYNHIQTPVRRLRIKGFTKEEGAEITLGNIQNFMDYQVEEVSKEQEIPMEAIQIAEILGLDFSIINNAKIIINR